MGNRNGDNSTAAYSIYDQRLWLEDLISRLSGPSVYPCAEGQYKNHPELPEHLRAVGYYACFQFPARTGHIQYAMISRSHTSAPISLQEIIDDLRSNRIVIPLAKFGEYYAERRQRRGPGTYATIQFGSRWYMISKCGQMKPYYRLAMPEKLRSEEDIQRHGEQAKMQERMDEIRLVRKPVTKQIIRANPSEEALRKPKAHLAELAAILDASRSRG